MSKRKKKQVKKKKEELTYSVRRSPGEKDRRCLKCEQMFLSDGPSNRLCDLCRKQNGNLCIAMSDDSDFD